MNNDSYQYKKLYEAYLEAYNKPGGIGVAYIIDRGWNNWTARTFEEFVERIKENEDFRKRWGSLSS